MPWQSYLFTEFSAWQPYFGIPEKDAPSVALPYNPNSTGHTNHPTFISSKSFNLYTIHIQLPYTVHVYFSFQSYPICHLTDHFNPPVTMTEEAGPLAGLTLQDQKLIMGAFKSLKNGFDVSLRRSV
jgi:hypothetical protein